MDLYCWFCDPGSFHFKMSIEMIETVFRHKRVLRHVYESLTHRKLHTDRPDHATQFEYSTKRVTFLHNLTRAFPHNPPGLCVLGSEAGGV